MGQVRTSLRSRGWGGGKGRLKGRNRESNFVSDNVSIKMWLLLPRAMMIKAKNSTWLFLEDHSFQSSHYYPPNSLLPLQLGPKGPLCFPLINRAMENWSIPSNSSAGKDGDHGTGTCSPLGLVASYREGPLALKLSTASTGGYDDCSCWLSPGSDL